MPFYVKVLIDSSLLIDGYLKITCYALNFQKSSIVIINYQANCWLLGLKDGTQLVVDLQQMLQINNYLVLFKFVNQHGKTKTLFVFRDSVTADAWHGLQIAGRIAAYK